MDCFTILAQAAEAASETPHATQGSIVPIDLIWDQITNLNTVEALTFASFGVVCLFYGWRVFKILVTMSFALFGLCVGIWTSKLLIGGSQIWLGIICMVLFAFLSVPLMRYGVSEARGIWNKSKILESKLSMSCKALSFAVKILKNNSSFCCSFGFVVL